MKAIILIFVCVALLPSIIPGVSDNQKLNRAKNKIDEIVRNGGNIGDVFEPLAFLGRGTSCITYEGELIKNNKIVAMKFAPSRTNQIKIELEMYSYLNAVDNETVENYGIPAVYYYGKWDENDMIAITLLDSQFHEIQGSAGNSFSILDVFIICREYVRISKYMHRHGVCHGDSHLANMMFRGNRGFIIDFNLASKVGDWIYGDCRRRDWDKFLYNVHNLYGMDVKPTDIDIFEGLERIPNEELKSVLLKFAHSVHKEEQINYDETYQLITEIIHDHGVREPAMVSWLTDEQKREALDEWETNSTPNIQSIDDPYATIQCPYPPPNYNYFTNQ